MQIDTLITHAGRFHADDLLAYAMVSTLFPEAKLIRTRDPEVISRSMGCAVIFDVGHDYDPELQIFDHHQADKPRRPTGGAYSSFGLIWRHFGHAYLRRQAQLEGDLDQLHARIDARFVQAIDAADNLEIPRTIPPVAAALSLPRLLEALNPKADAPRSQQDLHFSEASTLAKRLLDGQIQDAIQALHVESLLRRAIESRGDTPWIEIDQSVPFDDAAAELSPPDLLYVIAPGPGEWILKAISHAPGAMVPRKPLPPHWAGLRGDALQNACGVADARFCHAARFLAVSETRDGAIALLQQALRF